MRAGEMRCVGRLWLCGLVPQSTWDRLLLPIYAEFVTLLPFYAKRRSLLPQPPPYVMLVLCRLGSHLARACLGVGQVGDHVAKFDDGGCRGETAHGSENRFSARDHLLPKKYELILICMHMYGTDACTAIVSSGSVRRAYQT